jgi:cystathionine beta-lyase/cystathionine gamma-synthase
MKFATKAVHSGQEPEPTTGAVIPPIFISAVFNYEDIGKTKGYEYTRLENPTRSALERTLAELEGGKHALAFSSGMSAISAATSILKPGDHMVVSEDIYGGTYNLFQNILAGYGIGIDYVNTCSIEDVGLAIKANTKMLWLETPSNPMLKITNLKEITELAKAKGIVTAVDNTFATPYFQNPLLLGADVVMHSMTKYLGGHSDITGGALVTSGAELFEKYSLVQKSVGAVLSPLECYLARRGIKTLALRMEKHAENAQRIAEYLASHQKLTKVIYPGLSEHPQHELAKNQMSGFGGIVTVELNGGADAARKLVRGTRLFTFAGSLGAVESIISHPASSSHKSLPEKTRAKLGITDALVRLSVGVEDGDDLIADLKDALKE